MRPLSLFRHVRLPAQIIARAETSKKICSLMQTQNISFLRPFGNEYVSTFAYELGWTQAPQWAVGLCELNFVSNTFIILAFPATPSWLQTILTSHDDRSKREGPGWPQSQALHTNWYASV